MISKEENTVETVLPSVVKNDELQNDRLERGLTGKEVSKEANTSSSSLDMTVVSKNSAKDGNSSSGNKASKSSNTKSGLAAKSWR